MKDFSYVKSPADEGSKNPSLVGLLACNGMFFAVYE